jgi:hypothetical protein
MLAGLVSFELRNDEPQKIEGCPSSKLPIIRETGHGDLRNEHFSD